MPTSEHDECVNIQFPSEDLTEEDRARLDFHSWHGAVTEPPFCCWRDGGELCGLGRGVAEETEGKKKKKRKKKCNDRVGNPWPSNLAFNSTKELWIPPTTPDRLKAGHIRKP